MNLKIINNVLGSYKAFKVPYSYSLNKYDRLQKMQILFEKQPEITKMR